MAWKKRCSGSGECHTVTWQCAETTSEHAMEPSISWTWMCTGTLGGFMKMQTPLWWQGWGLRVWSYKAPEASHLWITRQVAESKRFQCKWLSVENTSILCPLHVSVGLEHKSMRKNFLWHQSQNTQCPVHVSLICSFNHFFPTCWCIYMVGLGCYNSSPPPLVVVIL